MRTPKEPLIKRKFLNPLHYIFFLRFVEPLDNQSGFFQKIAEIAERLYILLIFR